MGSSDSSERRINLVPAWDARLLLAGVLLATTAFGDDAVPAVSQPPVPGPQLRLELNKLEQQGESCVIWTVFENRLDTGLDALKLDLVFFDADGLIQRRLALDAAPLAADKTMVKVFKIPAMRCDALGRVLVNHVVACAGPKGTLGDCLERMQLSSRGAVELIK